MLAFDTETEMIEPGCLAPRLVCMSTCDDKGSKLFGRHSACDYIRSYLGKETLIGHNVAYDLGVLCAHDESLVPLVFEAYEKGLIRDTLIREQLILIREGKAIDEKRPSLGSLAEKYLNITLQKENGWRFKYGLLMNTPLDKWPQEAKDYSTGDAVSTYRIFNRQGGDIVSYDEILQTRAYWVLHLMALWGFRTDETLVKTIKKDLEKACKEAEEHLLKTGIYKIAGTKKAPKLAKDMSNIRSRILNSLGDQAPRTEKGQISTETEVLERCGDPGLQVLAKIAAQQKLLTTFIPYVEQGTKMPITPAWNGLVRTGRTSCGAKSNPGNWQNLPREGQIRECVIPRDGYLFGGADYSQLELCTLAQTCLDWFGASDMAKAIQSGKDLHLALACSTSLLLGDLDYGKAKELKTRGDERVDSKRQFAKVANFGYPGGLGADSFVAYAKGMAGIVCTTEEARALKNAWLAKWPEMNQFFAKIATMSETGAAFEQPYSRRIRGGANFCSMANSAFQGRAADGAKIAMWEIAKKCYQDKKSPLFGSRIVLFIHDEFIIESPKDLAAEATDAMCKIMVESMQRVTPDIPIKAEPRLMNRWLKKAKEVRNKEGKLIPWQEKQ